MYMENTNREKELKTFIYSIRIYGHGLGVKLGIEKCAIVIMEKGHNWRNGTNK